MPSVRQPELRPYPAKAGGVMAGLGINKDLEPLVRRVRRIGGGVNITRRNHVVWTFPTGELIRSGLTMSSHTARIKQREIERALARC